MNYPFWDIPIGYGLLMAAISILHVFISHFAIGGGLYLVITETIARKRNDTATLQYLEGLSKFFVLTTLVLGALTGVGIWFVIGLLSPAATDLLIHNFVWAWAIEWTFFVIEIAAALFYYYGWRRMSAADHLKIGWIYFVAAWLSLVVINGILAFMLTPGDWLESGNFWAGFLNPTYFSSMFFRTGVCILLAGVFGYTVATLRPADQHRSRLLRYNSIWGLVGLAVMAPTFYWYWKAIPDDIITTALAAMPTPINSINGSFYSAAILLLLLVVFGLFLNKRTHFIVGLAMMAAAFGYFGEFEFFRESVRKPYIVTGFMYGNSLEVAHADTYMQDGLLVHMQYTSDDSGRDLFNRACRSCHTFNNYKPLAPAFAGADREFITGMIMGTGAMRGNMPPFLGTEEDADLIAEYIHRHTDQRHIAEITGLSGEQLGEKVYRLRCGSCHVMGGYQDVSETMLSLEPDGIEEVLDLAGDFADEMPAFTGDDVEREALIAYFMSLRDASGGTHESAGL